MRFRFIRCSSALLLCAALSACSVIDIKDNVVGNPEAASDTYAKNKNSHGVVLLDVNWGRVWGCAKYENVQLVTFAFDRMPLKRSNAEPAEFIVTTPGRLSAKQAFESYAYQVPPGEYALSHFKIKVAQSASNVGYFVAGQNDLLKDGKPYAGSFRVGAGETV